MRLAGISFAVGIILFGLFIYMTGQVTSPLAADTIEQLVANQKLENADQFYKEIAKLRQQGILLNYIQPNRAFLILAILSGSLFAVLFGFHAVIDKFFFKAFYLPPDYRLAARRSLIATSVIAAIILIRFFAVDNWAIPGSILLGILLEWAIALGINYWRRRNTAIIAPNESNDHE